MFLSLPGIILLTRVVMCLLYKLNCINCENKEQHLQNYTNFRLNLSIHVQRLIIPIWMSLTCTFFYP